MMKARELPENPNEGSELLHELTDIACEDAGRESITKALSCFVAETARRAAGVLTLPLRATRSVLALLTRPLRAALVRGARDSSAGS